MDERFGPRMQFLRLHNTVSLFVGSRELNTEDGIQRGRNWEPHFLERDKPNTNYCLMKEILVCTLGLGMELPYLTFTTTSVEKEMKSMAG